MSEGERKIRLNLRGQSDEPAPKELEKPSQSEETPFRAPTPSPQPSIQLTKPKQRSKNSATLPASGGILSSRGKKPKADIGDVWEDLKARQMSDDESILANRELGEIAEKVGSAVGGLSKRIKTGYKSAATMPRPKPRPQPQKQALKLRMSPDRLKNPSSATRTEAAESPKSARSFPKLNLQPLARQLFASRRRKIALAAIAVLAGLMIVINRGGSDPDVQVAQGGSETLGTNITSNDIDNQPEQVAEFVRVTGTPFDINFPGSKNFESLEVVQVNPPGSDPVYAYVDVFNGVELRVSQQEIPAAFEGKIASELENVAKSFQATDIIQIDDNTVYHGFTEQFGGVQSLIFVKNDALVFISSPKQFADNEWAGYILSLN